MRVQISVNDYFSSFKSKKSKFNLCMKSLIINFNINFGYPVGE